MHSMKAHLAEPIANPEPFIKNPDWAMEQKLDGHRVLVVVEDGVVKAYNRNGEPRNVPQLVRDALAESPPFSVPTIAGFKVPAGSSWRYVLDGELVEGTYWIFDLLEMPGHDLRGLTWLQRRQALGKVARFRDREGFDFTTWVREEAQKRELFEACLDKEGVMFKDVNSTYRPGRWGSWRKFKHIKTCEVVVAELNRKGKAESMSVGLYDESGTLREVAGCRILPQFTGQIKMGDVVEVKYLYATENHKITQPVLLRLRPDRRAEECTMDQLIYTDKSVVK